jgi:hypothetical protein
MGLKLVMSPPIHSCSYSDWNQYNVIAMSAPQRSLNGNENLRLGFFQRPDAFSPLSADAAMDLKWINGPQ